MKKNIIVTCSIILSAALLFTSCKKESTQVSKSTNEIDNLQVGNNSSCKATQIVWGYWYTWDFHYTDKGLADEWKIDFGYGNVLNFKMKYDKFNKLTEASGYDAYDNLIITTSFTYSDKHVISQKWNDILAGTNLEVLFFYNTKGQLVKEDDNGSGTHVFLTYDNAGNWTRSDYYIGSDIYYSDIYEYGSQARDPLLTVSGVDWPFPFYGGGHFTKLWFSRNLSIVYDGDGNQYVINDLNASKTDFNTGYQNFPLSINYYDKVSAGPFDFTFGYSCNGNSNFANQAFPQGNSITSTNKTIGHPGPVLLAGSGKSIKEQLQELRKQYAK